MSSIAQKLFFSAENILGALSSDILKDLELPRSAFTNDPAALGKGSYSIAAIRLTKLTNRIDSITATLSENYSSTKKNSNPISQLMIFGVSSDNLYFARNINDSLFASSDFRFNDVPILGHSGLSDSKLNFNNKINSPTNIVSFKAVSNLANTGHDLHFFAKYVKNIPCILDNLQRIFWFSFYDQFTLKNPIMIPSQVEYLLIFPYVTLPVVPSKMSIATANIYTSYFLNIELGEA